MLCPLLVVDDEDEEEECDDEGCWGNAELIVENEVGIAVLESKCSPMCVL